MLHRNLSWKEAIELMQVYDPISRMSYLNIVRVFKTAPGLPVAARAGSGCRGANDPGFLLLALWLAAAASIAVAATPSASGASANAVVAASAATARSLTMNVARRARGNPNIEMF